MITRILPILVLVSNLGCGSVPSLSSGSNGSNGSQGSTGAAGATGASGLPGATGATGTGMGITSGIDCSQVDNSVGNSILVQYQSVKFTNGARYTQCSIVHTMTTSTSSKFYASTQTEATTGYCYLADDLDGSGATTWSTYNNGRWTFDYTGSYPIGTYTDPSGSYSGHTVNFISANCTSL